MSLERCFDCADWDVLHAESDNINENLDIFNSYINFCTNMIVPTKDITIYFRK